MHPLFLKNYITIFLLISISALISTQALSNSHPPLPTSKKQQLQSTEQNLQKQTQKKEKLEKNVKKLEKDLRSTKEKLIDLGQSIQSHERKLQTLEKQTQEKEIEKQEIETNLRKDHKYIARLVLALQRIRRIPPEAVIIKPGVPLKNAQSVMLLERILPTIHEDTKRLREKIERLDTLTHKLNQEKQQLFTVSKELSEEHKSLTTLIKKRENLYQRTNSSLKKQKDHVQKISKQVKNLNELVTRLEKERQRKENNKKQQKKKLASLTRTVTNLNSALQSPVSGVIKSKFGEQDAFGAPRQGIEIEGQNGALVVAPISGKVQFAGSFKNYKNLIIIQHKKGYHSLIAGLGKINVAVGHEVSSGEPLGQLNFTSDKSNPVLYYELRLNGKPVNPVKRLKGFS